MVKPAGYSFLLLGLAAMNAAAVGKGRTLKYEGTTMAPVFFDGTTHGLYRCSDCHAMMFPMKKITKLTHAEMDAGRYCGACHDGNKAFSTQANCQTCHRSATNRPPAENY